MYYIQKAHPPHTKRRNTNFWKLQEKFIFV